VTPYPSLDVLECLAAVGVYLLLLTIAWLAATRNQYDDGEQAPTFAHNYAAAMHGLLASASRPMATPVAGEVTEITAQLPALRVLPDSDRARDAALSAIATAARRSPPVTTETYRHDARWANAISRLDAHRLWEASTPETTYSLEQWASYALTRLMLAASGERQVVWIPDDADLADVLKLVGVDAAPVNDVARREGFRLVSLAYYRG
jgi:hypothetical protein